MKKYDYKEDNRVKSNYRFTLWKFLRYDRLAAAAYSYSETFPNQGSRFEEKKVINAYKLIYKVAFFHFLMMEAQ